MNEADRDSRPDLTGKAAIVTGGGRGIGRAIAVALARRGCDVAVIARSANELEEVAREIGQEGRRAVAVVADLTLVPECERAVAEAVAALGPPDVLVNNAGAARFGPVESYTAEDLDWHYAVNFRSTYIVSREALRHMIPRRAGTIVNIASSSGKKPYRHQGPYCAMKAAVIALSKVMALELREYGIRVHAVCPGAVDTRMADVVHPERDRTGWMQAEDVAQVVLDLLALPSHLTVDEVVMRRFMAEPM